MQKTNVHGNYLYVYTQPSHTLYMDGLGKSRTQLVTCCALIDCLVTFCLFLVIADSTNNDVTCDFQYMLHTRNGMACFVLVTHNSYQWIFAVFLDTNNLDICRPFCNTHCHMTKSTSDLLNVLIDAKKCQVSTTKKRLESHQMSFSA